MSIWSSLRKWLHLKSKDERALDRFRRQGEAAYYFVQRGNCLTAKEILLRVLERRNEIHDPLIVDWLLELLAWVWTSTEQFREATDYLSKYLIRYPSDVRAHTLRAASLRYAGDLRDAIEGYSKALEINSEDILAHMGRGQVLAELGEYSRAANDLDFALDHLERFGRLDPSWNTQIRAYSLNGRAFTHAGLGHFDRAFAEFDRSISLCPDNAWAYFNRAMVNESRGQLTAAAADYSLSLQKALPKLTPLKRKYAEVKLKAITT